MTVYMMVRGFEAPQEVFFALIFAPLFAFTAGMAATTVFLPNSWHRLVQKKKRAWRIRHPILEWFVVITGTFLLLYRICFLNH